MAPQPCFNELVHAPNRLQICAILAGVGTAEFSAVRQGLGVTDSVLSKHVAALHDAGYVDVHKSTCASRVRTSLSLTPAGRAVYAGHVAALLAIVEAPAGDGGLPQGARPGYSSRQTDGHRRRLGAVADR